LSDPDDSASGLSVIKVGGSLLRAPHQLDRVCAALGRCSSLHLVVVPGGGPLADTVRELDGRLGLSAAAAHWMAILAMDQYAHVLADRIRGSRLVEEPGDINQALCGGSVAVLAPSRWMRSADVLPHSWEVTSDSVAAFVAGALGALRLVLIKPTTAAEPVDLYFIQALPAGLPYLILPWDEVDDLPSRLSG
jgi:5-(aminomethyl)-3-furanmethanol phosphate kinase